MTERATLPSLSVARADAATELVRRRYDRIASIYDVAESLMELRARRWRRDLWTRVEGPRVLELGVGTAKSARFYRDDLDIVGVDLSERMLARAERRIARFGRRATLMRADAQCLPFAAGSFDTVVTTFFFCSVPEPMRALAEARRVLVPGGRLLCLEHVLSDHPALASLSRWISPLTFALWGARMDRRTVETVRDAGFEALTVTSLWLDVVRRIEVRAAGIA